MPAQQQPARNRLALVSTHVLAGSPIHARSHPPEHRCLSAGGHSARLLRAAPFEFDVTPPLGCPLMDGGVAAAAEIKTPLTARGVVLLDLADGPVVLCSVDWTDINNESHDRLRAALARGCGTTPDRVALHTVHQHDAPGCDSATERLLESHGLAGVGMVEPYMPDLDVRFEAATRGAAATGGSLVTHIGVGSAEVDRVASNRHIMGPDGLVKIQRYSSTGTNPEAAAAPEGLVDKNLQVLGLWSGQDALLSLSYYATHPMCGYGQGSVQWDFIGMAREQFEQSLPAATGPAVVHFTGAAGNVAVGKYNDGQPQRKAELADRVAAAMISAWKDAGAHRHPLLAAEVAWHVEPVVLPLKPELSGPEGPLLARIADASNGKNDLRNPASVYPRIFAAQDVVYARRARVGQTIDLTCLQFGTAARVLGMPGELFVEYQLAAQKMVKAGTAVMMAAYGDQGPGYIGTAASYSYGPLCYETSPDRNNSRVSSDVEEVLMGGMRRLLDAADAIDQLQH